MKTKKIFCMLMTCALILSMMPAAAFAADPPGGGTTSTMTAPSGVWSDHTATAFAGGSGTETEPYQIATAEQLALLAADVNSGIPDKTHVNKYFQLTADIDLSAHRWIPIGQGTQFASFHAFCGYFDGNGKTISGMYVDESSEKYSAGLFGNFTGGLLKNLAIKNAFVRTVSENPDSSGRSDSAGILIGSAVRGNGATITVQQCYVSGTVESSTARTGGLMGYNSYGSYKDCIAEVVVNGAGKAGGFVGEDFNGRYDTCEAKGNVNGTWSVGGFAGVLYFGSNVKNCAAHGKVTASNWNAGGFAGYIENNVSISKCTAFSDVESTVNSFEPKVGGFAGTIDSRNGKCAVKNCHASGKITAASTDYKAGGFIGNILNNQTNQTNAADIADCSFDAAKNEGLKAVGGNSASASEQTGVQAATTQEALSKICSDYYGSHDIKKIDAKEATTTEAGWAEHYECERCKQWFKDADGNTPTETVLIPKKQVYSGGGYIPTVQKPEIIVGEGGQTELSKDGTTLIIKPDDRKEVASVKLNGKDLGKVTEIKNLKTGDKVEIAYQDKPEAKPSKAELDKQIKEKTANLKIAASSKRTKNGNIRIHINAKIQAIQDAGYTVKYQFYRSTKKSSGYRSQLTKKTSTYTNTTGQDGTMYYYKVKVLVYDQNGKLVAQTKLQQCNYANRRWSA